MIPQFTKESTFGDCLDPAMKVTDPEEAKAYLEAYTQHIAELRPCGTALAVKVARENLGYWAGYYDNETRARVERLFGCAHPAFGAIAEKGPPTPEEAFEMGKKAGEAFAKKPTPM